MAVLCIYVAVACYSREDENDHLGAYILGRPSLGQMGGNIRPKIDDTNNKVATCSLHVVSLVRAKP